LIPDYIRKSDAQIQMPDASPSVTPITPA
jgi:hypothetical protein